MTGPTPPEHAPLRETLRDLVDRLPAYTALSQRLAAEGRLSAGRSGQIIDALGPFTRVSGSIPGLRQALHVAGAVDTVHLVLTQLQPDVADEHLTAVGLTRDQVETDYRIVKQVLRQSSDTAGSEALRLATEGARVAGRLTGRLRRAVASRDRTTTGSDASSADDER